MSPRAPELLQPQRVADDDDAGVDTGRFLGGREGAAGDRTHAEQIEGTGRYQADGGLHGIGAGLHRHVDRPQPDNRFEARGR